MLLLVFFNFVFKSYTRNKQKCFETLAEWSCDKILLSSPAGGVLLLYVGLLGFLGSFVYKWQTNPPSFFFSCCSKDILLHVHLKPIKNKQVIVTARLWPGIGSKGCSSKALHFLHLTVVITTCFFFPLVFAREELKDFFLWIQWIHICTSFIKILCQTKSKVGAEESQ